MSVLPDEDQERQIETQLTYIRLHSETTEAVETYLAERAGEADSVASMPVLRVAMAELR